MQNDLFASPRFHSIIPPIFIVAVSFYLLALHDENQSISLLLLVFLIGAAGGVTSTYLRLKNIATDTLEETKTITDNKLAILQVYLSPIMAGIFAWIAYSFFLTEIISGPIFPAFDGISEEYESVRQLFKGIQPKTLKDAALTLVWAYIAGFSEKFIPNILDKLSNNVAIEGGSN